MNKLLSATYALIATLLLSAPAFADIVDPRPIDVDNPASAAIVGAFLFSAALASGFLVVRKLKGNN